MVQQKGRAKFDAGAVGFIVQHELWDGNVQDHSDQGVAILVTGDVNGKDTTLLRFNCFDIERAISTALKARIKPTGWTTRQTETPSDGR